TDQECVLRPQSYYTIELFKALEKGYQILDIDEVWHWRDAKRSNIVFRSFMLKWLKVKICTSGYPVGCNSEEDRLNFVSKLNKHYSFEIDILPTEIVKNPVSKTLGKNTLNCTCGRFGMITNRSNTSMFDNYDDAIAAITAPNVKLQELFGVADDSSMLIVTKSLSKTAPIRLDVSLVITGLRPYYSSASIGANYAKFTIILPIQIVSLLLPLSAEAFRIVWADKNFKT
ncbi:hypothetical protein, partial [Pseudoalteromonas sp.]|uniref:hypothetical protein n=1 Tax=Pseudoalteromonas sp. TaxID=53249 RepID=UPI00261FAA19